MKSTQRAEGGSIDFSYARKISLSTNYYTCVTKYFSCVVWGVPSKRFALSLHHDVGLVDKSRFGLFPKSLVDDWLLIEDVSSTRDRKQSLGRNILLSYHGGENRRHPSTMGTREQLCPLILTESRCLFPALQIDGDTWLEYPPGPSISVYPGANKGTFRSDKSNDVNFKTKGMSKRLLVQKSMALCMCQLKLIHQPLFSCSNRADLGPNCPRREG